ncbi:MAG: DUF4332 domain-containing protein, partial [Bacteroidales bacterium]|nr:DUF4332 domain-containing protein [Bacteroidales bacterium]
YYIIEGVEQYSSKTKIKLKEFPGISAHVVSALEKLGIKDTLKLYDRVLTAKKRKELSKETEIPETNVTELTCLCDLSRIKWVGVTFARMLYDIGIDSVEKAAQSDPEKLHQRINQFNKDKNIFKGHIGLNDIRIFAEAAKEVPQEIEYE